MRAEKQLLLDEIAEKLDEYPCFILANYQGFKGNDMAEFRKELVNLGAEMEVVRKRVFYKAAEGKNIEVDASNVNGPLAIIFAKEDGIEAAKLVVKQQKEQSTPEIMGGHFDGRFCTTEEVAVISKLPSKDEMRAQFLGLLEAPAAQTVSVMNSLVCSVIYCLDNKSKQ